MELQCVACGYSAVTIFWSFSLCEKCVDRAFYVPSMEHLHPIQFIARITGAAAANLIAESYGLSETEALRVENLALAGAEWKTALEEYVAKMKADAEQA